jgi:hypothetical protein
MFGKIPVFENDPGFLRDLADQMHDSPGAGGDNPDIPAGFTYLGQFVDHDITFDPASSLQRFNDPEALRNFRTPRFDLDSLYGRGPDDEPYLYDLESPGGAKLLVGRVLEDDDSVREQEHDLPRNRLTHSRARALIGDPRNDENTFVGQLHLTFIKFHNRVVDRVREQKPGLKETDLFKEAQREVRWHYQWVVIHDFLPRIVGRSLLDRLLLRAPEGHEEVKLRFYRPRVRAFMPLEFSVAAYRYGHSQVRGRYRINNTVPVLPTFAPGPLQERRQDFRGFRGLPPFWTIDWPFFFEVDEDPPQASRAIDTKLTDPLFSLPNETGDDDMSLARRNLLRGLRLSLPPGERVAAAMGERPLGPGELGFNEPAPLWFYVLKEAEVREDGARLGPVGGRIVAETFLGLLRADPLSYFHVEPTWRPTLPAAEPGDFTMADLIRFAVPEQAQRNPRAGDGVS